MAPTCLAMVPAVAQALQRLTAAAMAYPSRPGNTAHRHMRASRDRAKEADVNINLPTMHDKPSCLGRIRSCLSGRRLPAPIILICARRGLCRHASVGMQNGGYARALLTASSTRAAALRDRQASTDGAGPDG